MMREPVQDKIALLAQMVRESDNIVFFGGAGVSTESGIPDFRSEDGLYRMKYAVSPETVLSAGYFKEHTEEFYRFYREKMLFLRAKPNAAHYKLAEWEKAGKLRAVITQNIDGLHQLAGSEKVYELHGSVYRNRCRKCGKKYSVETIVGASGVPRCSCGGVIKPEVVLYGEALDDNVVMNALAAIAAADMLIVAGTSLTVYPAAGFVNYFTGKNFVLINRDETSYDSRANLVIHERIGEVFSKL